MKIDKQKKESNWPADLYLEGNDQFRGWFNSSLITSTILTNNPPYRQVVTHGFVVDETGRVGTLSLLNNLGYGLDDEALRVVGMIPKFKSPAKANGEAVSVYFQLPIKFVSR